MAKSKTTKAGKAKSESRSKGKAAPKQTTRHLALVNEDSPSSSDEFSGIQIGHAAGEVWGILSNDGPQTLAAIKKSVAAPPDVVMAAIGWLAREEKLDFINSGRTVKISLRERSDAS